VGVPGGKRGNVQTGGGDRVSTISQPGCNTSVALATGPTEEEEMGKTQSKPLAVRHGKGMAWAWNAMSELAYRESFNDTVKVNYFVCND